MSGSTENYEWPYPISSDRLADGAETIGQSVQDIDSDLAAHMITRTRHIPSLGAYFPEVQGADPTGATSSSAAINALLIELGAGGHVVLANGIYLIDAAVELRQIGQRITIEPSATVRVVSGYTGDVFRIGNPDSSIRGVVIDGGGTITEDGKSGGAATEPGEWTAFRFLAPAGRGTTACRIEGLQVQWAGTVLAWESQGNGWANGNQASRLRALYFKRLINMTTPQAGVIGYSGNTVKDVMAQCGNTTEYLIRNLRGRGWSFIDVSPWDIGLNPAAVSAQIMAGVEDVRIFGGLLTGQNFTSAAAPGQVSVIDRVMVPPWLVGQDAPVQAAMARTDVAGVATKIIHDGWPVWKFPETISGITFLWRAPMGAYTRVLMEVVAFGLAAGSGNIQFAVTLQLASTSAGQATRTSIIPNPGVGNTTAGADLVLGSQPATPGGLYRIWVTRNAGAANDTFVGDAGLAGVLMTPSL
jgi:hypothetical protein